MAVGSDTRTSSNPHAEAPKAETANRTNQSRTDKPSFAQVRILQGVGVIENVFVDGRPLADVARETK